MQSVDLENEMAFLEVIFYIKNCLMPQTVRSEINNTKWHKNAYKRSFKFLRKFIFLISIKYFKCNKKNYYIKSFMLSFIHC